MQGSKKRTSRRDQESTLVYATHPTGPARCRQCLRLMSDCVCGRDAPTSRAAGDGIVRLWRETRGRKGTGVTLIKGLALSPAELDSLASRFKKLCGVGGTVRDDVIEIQGEQRARLQPELEKLGYQVKIAGG